MSLCDLGSKLEDVGQLVDEKKWDGQKEGTILLEIEINPLSLYLNSKQRIERVTIVGLFRKRGPNNRIRGTTESLTGRHVTCYHGSDFETVKHCNNVQMCRSCTLSVLDLSHRRTEVLDPAIVRTIMTPMDLVRRKTWYLPETLS